MCISQALLGRSLWSGHHWKDLFLLQKLSIDDTNFGQIWWHQKWKKGSSWPVTAGMGGIGLIKSAIFQNKVVLLSSISIWNWRVIIAVNFPIQATGQKKPEKNQDFNGIWTCEYKYELFHINFTVFLFLCFVKKVNNNIGSLRTISQLWGWNESTPGKLFNSAMFCFHETFIITF